MSIVIVRDKLTKRVREPECNGSGHSSTQATKVPRRHVCKPFTVIHEGEALGLSTRDPEGHFYIVKSLFTDGHWEVQNRWYRFFEHVFTKVMRPMPT